MELISRISKGSNMDQIYLPKNRHGLSIGSYVIVRPLDAMLAQKKELKLSLKLCFYNVTHVEPVKLEVIRQIFALADELLESYENIIITGSFVEQGFNFNDIDIILISEYTENHMAIKKLASDIDNRIGIKVHFILLDNKALAAGLSTDPLYEMMLSKCIAKKRFIYKYERELNYKLLDLNLLKSKTLIDNFELLDGNEKYYLARNMVAIALFLDGKKVTMDKTNAVIKKAFELKNIVEIKNNMLDKGNFLRAYEKYYKETFTKIMQGIKHGSKQE